MVDLGQLMARLRALSPEQLQTISSIVSTLHTPHTYWRYESSDVVDKPFLVGMGDTLRIHHSMSAEPFSKDKFEFATVSILNASGRDASLAPKGNPGWDVSVGGVRWSLKTQADSDLKIDKIWISKFMELGKGRWENETDLVSLREQFLRHLTRYDRIFTLRHWEVEDGNLGHVAHHYEMVEIPKSLLELASDGDIQMQHGSIQNPKPGYCVVKDVSGVVLYKLYFDAGGERKLQVKALRKDRCVIHAYWEFEKAH